MTPENEAPSLDVVVVGGSQAGLAIGYHLAQRGLRFVILDAGPEIGLAWRSRWDSLRLFTPAQYSSLPGMAFPAPKDTYPGKDEVAAYLQAYASASGLPVRLNARVTSLTKRAGAYLVATADEGFTARQVVVATGPFQVPFVPPAAADVGEGVMQIHSADYRNPAQLPDGRVLVVGGGNSGFQIAEELAETRRVDLAVGRRMPSLPQRLLGKDLFWWLTGIGFMKVSTDSRLGRKLAERIQHEKAPALRRDAERAVDESCWAARPVRRRERTGRRRDRLGDGISTGSLLDRCPRCQGSRRPDRPSTWGDRRVGPVLPRAHVAAHAGLGAHRIRVRRCRIHREARRSATGDSSRTRWDRFRAHVKPGAARPATLSVPTLSDPLEPPSTLLMRRPGPCGLVRAGHLEMSS